jgi:hypothetical protein
MQDAYEQHTRWPRRCDNMLRGIHTLRNGFSTSYDPSADGPRKYSLDNSNYELNMRIVGCEIMSLVDPGQLDMGNSKILFVIATTEAGATPQTVTGDSNEDDDFQLRFNDDSQIVWGTISPQFGPQVIVDPGHIIPGDLYVNAWSMTTGANPNPLLCPMGYVITMVQSKDTGAEALLYQVKQSSN